ncbi:MAG: hypothetical protein EAZ81_04050 [Verrucomicrobia bacterium]|nr:MAG: hypothetical protein EAZ81_04050 [Verrucomicrobiota bacterium]
MTPKTRRFLLDPKSIKAWSDVFVRRNDDSPGIHIDELVARYVSDTNSETLSQDAKSSELLYTAMKKAIKSTWDLEVDENNIVKGSVCLKPIFMGEKMILSIPTATILNIASGFNDKDLTTRGSITGGTACAFTCVYCSSPTMMSRSMHTRILRVLNVKHSEVILRRFEPVKILRMQLSDKKGLPRYKDDNGVVILSPIVDPLANMELMEESFQMILAIMELTNWDVRILTKSMLIKKLATKIPDEYRHRIIYGLSIGTLDDRISRVVEKLTSPPRLRMKAYRELQRQGLRTYSMHCPILPQSDYSAFAEKLAAEMNWQADELVWGEALNLRGDSVKNTIAALEKAELHDEANLLARVSRSRVMWETQYNRPLFEALASVCPPEKLRYLVYPAPEYRDYWLGLRDRGAVVLGEEKMDD